MWQKGNRKLT